MQRSTPDTPLAAFLSFADRLDARASAIKEEKGGYRAGAGRSAGRRENEVGSPSAAAAPAYLRGATNIAFSRMPPVPMPRAPPPRPPAFSMTQTEWLGQVQRIEAAIRGAREQCKARELDLLDEIDDVE